MDSDLVGSGDIQRFLDRIAGLCNGGGGYRAEAASSVTDAGAVQS